MAAATALVYIFFNYSGAVNQCLDGGGRGGSGAVIGALEWSEKQTRRKLINI